MIKKIRTDKNILWAIYLITLLCLGFLITYLQIVHISTNSCYRSLKNAAAGEAEDLVANVTNDRELLETIAGLLSRSGDLSSSSVRQLICSFQQQRMISSIGLLLPDNTMTLCNGDSFMNTAMFDFETEQAAAPYLSGVITHPEQADYKFLYHAVPIIKDGKTAGILYGFIRLDTLSAFYQVNVFDGAACLYVIDAATGNIILDTQNNNLQNVYNVPVDEKIVKHGYSLEEMQEHIANGIPGNIAFYSKTAGEYMYAYYEPVSINQWVVMLVVPENAAFSDSVQIRQMFFLLSAINVSVLIFYFIGVLRNVRQDNHKKEQQLTQTLYMLDIQQTLFDAHKNPELIGMALEKCANLLDSKNAFLITLNGTFADCLFFWSEKTGKYTETMQNADMSSHLPYISARLQEQKSILFNHMEDLKNASERDYETLIKKHVFNLLMTPVLDSSGNLTGLLGTSNFQKEQKSAALLECVSFNFFMAVNNLNSYRRIEEMGTVDTLTGLLNRNKYQADLDEYGREHFSVGCIYMDANGLHELNNHLGHAAGDEMLHFIGSTLKNIFGREGTYRIGGDEFIVLCRNLTESDIQEKIELLSRTLLEHHYHVSIGEAYQETTRNIDLIVSEAEHRMYEAKRRYYEEKGDEQKIREMNQKLEQILLEKKDYDSFLSIISSYFMGVYVVNLGTDMTRSIYKPSYFASILSQSNYKFLESIQIYAKTYVLDNDRPAFEAFINYEKIEKALKDGKTPELHYHRSDGALLILRVYPASDFQETQKETFWLFEKEKEK